MLLYRHQLNRIVSEFRDPGQDIVREFLVCSDAFPVLGHTDVRLVNQRSCRRLFHERLIRPFKRLFRRPDPGAQPLGLFIHADPFAVSRQPFKPVLAPAYPQLDKLSVLQSVLSVQDNLPYAVFSPVQRMAVQVPAVEIACQAHLVCTRHPFPENPSGFRSVKSEIQRAVGKVRQRFRVSGNLPPFLLETVHAQLYIAGMRRQPRVDGGNLIRGFQFADVHLFPPTLLRFLRRHISGSSGAVRLRRNQTIPR